MKANISLRRLTMLTLSLALCSILSARDFEVMGICYDVLEDGKSVAVTFRDNNYNSYSGDMVIPAAVYYQGNTYAVRAIGDCAFLNCTSLTSILFLNTLETIGNNAFYNCHRLTFVTLPQSVKSIGNFAFSGCTNLFTVVLPNSLERLGRCVFEKCSAMTTMSIPASVYDLGEGTFKGCINLSSLIVESRNPRYYSAGNVIYDMKSGEAVCVAGRAKSLAIEDGITHINKMAFSDCFNLSFVSLPVSVTSISDDTFADCIGLKSIVLYGSNPPQSNGGLNHNITVYVPEDAVQNYKSATAWANYKIMPIKEKVTP